MDTKRSSLRKKIRLFIVITMIGLVINGLSAFFLEPELKLALHFSNLLPDALSAWLTQVYTAVEDTLSRYPYMLYGYDWLGFTHILIAIAFIGPLKNPIKNEWVVKFGMITALLSILIALVFERMRSVPSFWTAIDVIIGITALVILYFCDRWVQQLKNLELGVS